jgi:predicted ATP-dependent protease
VGEYLFGRPTRITVNTSLGKSGVVNIEREADLSGPIHDKGVLVLSGWLREMFAQDKPLAMTASITHGVTHCPMTYFSPRQSLDCINLEKIQ